MFIFSVRDMRVSSQAAAVLEAVKQVDVNASVLVDLWAYEVRIAPKRAGATELSDAILHAGFNPELQNFVRAAQGQKPPRIPFEGFDHDFTASSPEERLRAEVVMLDYPPGAACPWQGVCQPAGKRWYAAWWGDSFLGYAFGRVDRRLTRKTPREENFLGRVDRGSSTASLLAPPGPANELTIEPLPASSPKVAGGTGSLASG